MMTSTDDDILKAILEEDENEPKIPQDINELTENLNFFITNNFLTQPVSHQQSLRIYYSASEKVSSMLCDLVHALCKHLDLPDTIYRDYEYAFNTVINDIVKTNTRLTSSVLSDSQNNSPIAKPSKSIPTNIESSPLRNLSQNPDSDENDKADGQKNERDQIKMLKEKIANLSSQLKDAKQTIESEEDTITSMSHERKNLENIFNKDLLELKIQIDQKQHENDSLKDEVIILSSKIKSAEERVESFKRQLDEANAMNDRMLANVQTANNKLIKKSQKISDLKTQVTNLNLKLKSIPTMDELNSNSDKNDDPNTFISPYTPKEKLKAMKAEEAIKLLTEANIKREADIQKKDKIIQKSFEIIQKELALIHEYEYRASIYDEEVDHNKRIIQSQSNANQKVKKSFEELKELLNEKENENKELKTQINDLKKQTDNNDPNGAFNNSTRYVKSNSNQNTNQFYESEDGEVKYGTVEDMKNEIDRLRGSVDILGTFIEDLLTKEDRASIPLLQSTAPILQDESLRNAILERIDQMKFAFSSYKKSPEIDFFFQVFKDNARGDLMIKSYIESGRNDLYAFLVALCAVDKRLLSFIRYQDTILESLNEYVPEGYENTEESLISFVADSRRVYDYLVQIYDILHGKGSAKKKQGFAPLFDILRQFKGMATMIEATFRREPFNFKETMNELPLFLQDYAIELQNQLNELQRMNIEKNEVIQELRQQQRRTYNNVSDTEYDELNAQIKRLSERIEGQVQKILSQKLTIETGQKTINRLNIQIDDLTTDKKECEINLNAFQIKCEELIKQNEKLTKDVDHLQKTLEAKNKIYQNRLEANLLSMQSKCDDEINILKKKHEEQITILNNNLQKKITKVHSLKSRIEDMQTSFDETTLDQRAEIIKLKQYIEESDGKIQDLKTKIAALKKAQEIAQQAANKQTLMSSFSPLQNIISFPVSPNPNPDFLMSPSVQDNERTEVNFLSTPTSSKSVNPSSNTSSITLSALSDKNDRFTSQIGRIIAKYGNESKSTVWTRTKVINSVTSLVDRVISLEKKINNSILIDVSSYNENNDEIDEQQQQQQKKKMAEIVRQGSLWQAWSNDVISLIGADRGDPDENRKFIRDFIVTTMSKCKLVFKLQLLRTQKRILVKNNNIISSYLSPSRYDQKSPFESITTIAPIILIVSFCFKLKKYSKSPLSSKSSSRLNSGFNTPAKMRLNRISISPQ